MPIDFEAEGLLKGTRGRNRQARLELLTELAADGVGMEELRRAVAEDRLALLPVERLLEGGGRRYTAREISELAGVELELLRRQRQALGLSGADPDEPTYTEDDLNAARRLRSVLDAGLTPDQIYDSARVMGLAASQLAAANRAVVGEAMLRKGDTELEAARRYSEAATALLPLLVMSLEHVLRLHIREQLRNDAIGRAGARGREPRPDPRRYRFASRIWSASRSSANGSDGRAGRGHRATRRVGPRGRVIRPCAL